MSPLLLVGLLIISTALGDVKHVLEGSAHPPKPSEINELAGPNAAFQTKNAQDFWWMGSNSPLKLAYDHYKKCSLKGNCANNVAVAKTVASGTATATAVAGGNIDIKKNPFFNGEYQSGKKASGASTKTTGFHAGASIDLSKNPFLSGKYNYNNLGEKIPNENGFIGVQPAKPFATNHPLENKKPFSTTHPALSSPNVSGAVAEKETLCKGEGNICVKSANCLNGIVNSNGEGLLQVRSDVQFCQQGEVCCRLASAGATPQKVTLNIPTLDADGKLEINNLNQVTAGKSSVLGSTLKFSGGAGLSPGSIQILPEQSIDPQISTAGESGHSSGSTVKPRDVSDNFIGTSTIDYSDVNFGDARFDSTFQAPDYLPPCPSGQVSTPSGGCAPPLVSCGPGQIKTPSGLCINTTPRPAVITCGFGQIKTPSGLCITPTSPSQPPVVITCGPGQIKTPSGLCIYPSTPAPPVIITCGPGQIKTPSGSCIYPSTPAPPVIITCGPGQIKTPSGSCIYPSTPAPPVIISCGPGQIRTPSGICINTTPRPAIYTCASGQIKTPSGLCITPTRPPPPPPVVVTCGYGQIKTPSGLCINTTPAPPQVVVITCGPGQIKTPSGSCIYPSTPAPPVIITCGPGQIKTPSGLCIYPSTPAPPVIITCGPGQIKTPSGSCIYPSTPAPPVIITCGPGQIKTPSGLCIYPSTPAPPVIITCGPGQIKTPSGSCIYPSTPAPPVIITCGPGQIKNQFGNCITPTRPPPPPPVIITCAPGQIRTQSGLCVSPPSPPPPIVLCGPGQIKTPTGSCVYPTTPQPDTNQVFVSCPPGTIRNYQNICEKISSPPTGPGYLPPPTQPPTTTPGDTEPDNTNTNTQTVVNVVPNIPDRVPTIPDRVPSTGSHVETTVQLPGCAAALKCVQEIYCTADGSVSAVPVILTKEQELLKVPTTQCRDPGSGTVGVCCRDPNYKDPWPSANLVNGVDDGQYKEDNFYGQGQIRNVREDKGPVAARSVLPGFVGSQELQANPGTECGTRNLNTQPAGVGPIDANFAEIPWQAMILRDTNRSLLCGGAIIRRDAVLTTAHCVEGLETSDILIKGGEWKLGIDEEPLPFQIVKVAAIIRHPKYVHGSLVNDLAVLKLDEKLRLAKNVGSICLPKPNQIPSQNCIATGWGKRILQLHAKNALMHKIDINIMDAKQCQETLAEKFAASVQNYSPNTLCGFSNVDQCKVDYGSALACTDSTGKYTLSGIYAWDTGCKQEGQIGGYVAPDVEWIEGTLSQPINKLKELDSEYNAKASN